MMVVDPVIALMVRIGLASLFAQAAVHKLRDRGRFALVLGEYRLLPEATVAACALALPAAEAATALLLLSPTVHAAGCLVAFGLLTLYGLAIAVNVLRGRRDIDCGCAGPMERRPIGWALVVRNGVLGTVALGGLLPAGGRALVWMDVVTITAATATLAACYTAVDRLLLVAPMRGRLRGTA